MSNDDRAEIVIVRRHGDHEDGHHGGAWKIAFADFMTALMALFLVLWLISSTNEDTKVSLARYFNPVKLVDMSPVKKGMADPSKADGNKDGTEDPRAKLDGHNKDEHKPAKAAKAEPGAKPEPPADPHAPKPAPAKAAAKPAKPEGATGTGGSAEATREAALFRDPYAVLAGIAAADRAQASATKSVDALGFSGTLPEDRDAFDDPFVSDAQAVAPAKPVAVSQPSPADDAVKKVATSTAIGSAEPALRIAEATQLQAELAKSLPKGTASRPEPAVDVRATKEGLLISLTDDSLFSMFSVGSAEPQGPTVEAMAKVAAVLKARNGGVVIRGFTDGRPYKSGVYDNWRLSSSRAHMAQYMLIRGGLDEKRIETVEGYADRRPKIASDPMAPQNRRIEILVRAEPAP